MKATSIVFGSLEKIKNCYIEIPKFKSKIYMYTLPDISDSKSVSYNDEAAIGRSMPFKTYNSSENRSISWTAHFIASGPSDFEDFMVYLRIMEACTYPFTNVASVPFTPPPICKLRCGELLSSSNSDDISAVLKSYSVKFDTSVPWDQTTLVPYKIDLDLQFDVVYNQSALPGAEKIYVGGI
jgi:hypothetical protein